MIFETEKKNLRGGIVVLIMAPDKLHDYKWKYLGGCPVHSVKMIVPSLYLRH